MKWYQYFALAAVVILVGLAAAENTKNRGSDITKPSRIWVSIEVGEKFKYWSSPVAGRGDARLDPNKDRDPNGWTKEMELHPSTADGSDATFYIAFHSKVFKFSEYCADPIKVSDGNFTVRMGPEDCDFHAASNDKPVKLEFVKYLERY